MIEGLSEAQTAGLEVIAAIAERPVDELERRHEMVADLGIDSPKALRLLLDLEDRLDIEISDEAAARMDTVGDVLDQLAGVG
ncbi:MAG: phosphopantetheine-binding protein [Acidobacteriota bacterium]